MVYGCGYDVVDLGVVLLWLVMVLLRCVNSVGVG